jgi:bifunctional DNA-binding transcriptional regulator/antitoxin component of YhaV-PrlF toxin-antitoxin module
MFDNMTFTYISNLSYLSYIVWYREVYIMAENLADVSGPKFYGATKIGARGQIVIPTEARKDFQITPATKLLVFGSPHGGGLMVIKAEFVTEFLSKATEMLKGLEKVVKTDEDNSRNV